MDAGDGIADFADAEVSQRQADKVAEQAGAELNVNPRGGVRESISAQAAEQGFENGDANQGNHQHIEAGQPAVDQHFVNDDLKQQRRYEREQLQEERSKNNFAEEAAVFDNCGNKPRNVEFAVFAVDELAAGHHQEAAVPFLQKGVFVEHLRAVAGGRILNQNFVVFAFAEDEI